jgi:hypothetical protein
VRTVPCITPTPPPPSMPCSNLEFLSLSLLFFTFLSVKKTV